MMNQEQAYLQAQIECVDVGRMARKSRRNAKRSIALADKLRFLQEEKEWKQKLHTMRLAFYDRVDQLIREYAEVK